MPHKHSVCHPASRLNDGFLYPCKFARLEIQTLCDIECVALILPSTGVQRYSTPVSSLAHWSPCHENPSTDSYQDGKSVRVTYPYVGFITFRSVTIDDSPYFNTPSAVVSIPTGCLLAYIAAERSPIIFLLRPHAQSCNRCTRPFWRKPGSYVMLHTHTVAA